MKAIAPTRAEGGFTLVELLVAMTLLGLLTVLLFGGLRFGTRAWQRAQENNADENGVRAAEQFLANRIAQAYPLTVSSGTKEGSVAFDGRTASMDWLSAASDAPGGMAHLHLAAAAHGDNLDLTVSSSAELATSPVPTVRHLLGKVRSFDISYLGRRSGEKTARWAGDWHAQPRLPVLIRVRVVMNDARLTWPDLVVAPRISADAGCMFDALTDDCRGR